MARIDKSEPDEPGTVFIFIATSEDLDGAPDLLARATTALGNKVMSNT
jgi:hypothetical protein